MRRRCRAVEVLLDIEVEHWLEVAKSTVLNNSKNCNKSIEDEEVEFSSQIVLRNEYPKECMKDVTEKFNDLPFSDECELGEKGRE
jgi:hypothetical protein